MKLRPMTRVNGMSSPILKRKGVFEGFEIDHQIIVIINI